MKIVGPYNQNDTDKQDSPSSDIAPKIVSVFVIISGFIIIRLMAELSNAGIAYGVIGWVFMFAAIPVAYGLCVVIFTPTRKIQKIASDFAIVVGAVNFIIFSVISTLTGSSTVASIIIIIAQIYSCIWLTMKLHKNKKTL